MSVFFDLTVPSSEVRKATSPSSVISMPTAAANPDPGAGSASSPPAPGTRESDDLERE